MLISRVVSLDSPARQSHGSDSLHPDAIITITKLQEEFRGLNPEDLDPMNPSYSCVICGTYECPAHNEPRTCCPKRTQVSESEWACFYNFKV